MRHSLTDTRPEFITPFDSWARLKAVAFAMALWDNDMGLISSKTERFLKDSTRRRPRSANLSYVNLSEVPPAVFSRRLSVVLNTWYQRSLINAGLAFPGDEAANVTAHGFDFGQLPPNGSVAQSVVDESCEVMCTRSTQATLAHSVEVYTYSPVWLALLFASSGVLLAVGVAGRLLCWHTRAPDILGYVASMTYNNPHFALPERGGVIEAMHRVRILHDLRVTVADVRGDAAVGHIALISGSGTRPLEKGRKYD
jgi:hypothetical protein